MSESKSKSLLVDTDADFVALQPVVKLLAREAEIAARQAVAGILECFPDDLRAALAPADLAVAFPQACMRNQFRVYAFASRLEELSLELAHLGELAGAAEAELAERLAVLLPRGYTGDKWN